MHDRLTLLVLFYPQCDTEQRLNLSTSFLFEFHRDAVSAAAEFLKLK